MSNEGHSAEEHHVSRRKFLRGGLGLAGAGLVHFTILGSLATPAEADPILNDNCCTTNDAADVCDCYQGDAPNDQGKQRDVCECNADKGAYDWCTCGNEPASDWCQCTAEATPGTADGCVCPPEGSQMVDCCTCGTSDTNGKSDVCECGADRGNSDPAAKDYCQCGDDTNASDNCTCEKDKSNPPGTGPDGADYCDCPKETVAVSDVCVAGGCYDSYWEWLTGCNATKLDWHRDQSASADVCQCTMDGTQAVDACKCWHDGSPQHQGQDPDGKADYCDCPTDASGYIDSCACCSDKNVADDCQSDEGGSTCYTGDSGFPAMADWCKYGDADADYCSTAKGTGDSDADGNDSDKRSDVCNSGEKSADVCACGTEGCANPGERPTDVCSCDGDAGTHDVCNPGQGASVDYCCTTPDTTGDV